MPDQQDAKPRPCCRGLFRFHRSTLVIALLVFLPWLLVALPGRINGGGGTTGFETNRFLHGLPFVFLERQTVEYSGTWANKIFTPGVKPKDVDFDEMAAKCMDAEFYQGSYRDFWFGLRFNSRTDADFRDVYELEISSITPVRFWSDVNRWPWLGGADGTAMRIHWLGLLVDVVLILLVFWMFAKAIEYRLNKRGTHFAFSLAEVLAVFCATGALTAWIGNEYQRAARENTAVDRLWDEATAAGAYLDGKRSNSLPVLVSELLDHRSSFPLLKTHMFRPVEQVSISTYDLEDSLEGTAESLANAIENTGLSIDLDCIVNERTLPLFQDRKALSAVRQLELRFDFDYEWDLHADDYVTDADLDFKLNLPNLKRLSLLLQSEIDQPKQLGILPSMKSLERLEIDEIDQKGVVYLSSIVENFPALKELDLSFGFDFVRDDKTDTFRDFIDPNFKVKLPVANETDMTISLQSEIDQRKQLGVFSSLKHVDHLKINGLNQTGVAYLNSADNEFPVAKQLEVSFDFLSDLDNPILANRYKIDLDFKLPFSGTEEIIIGLQPKFDQEKQLRMFAPLNRFKRLWIQGVNQQGAAYLNSIAKDLPHGISAEVIFESDSERIDLIAPVKEHENPFGF